MMSTCLSEEAVKHAVENIEGWSFQVKALERTIEGETYQHSLDLLYKIGQLAEDMNHHPDMTLSYKTLTIRFWSHDAGGITERDLDAAKKVNALLSK